MNSSRIIYWLATAFVLLFVGIGSIADFLKLDTIKASFAHIGFPEYLLPLFGALKLSGSIAILIRSKKILQEWAYAGIVFYFIGATYVHFAVGDDIEKIGVPLFILVATIISYIYSKK